MFDEGKIVFFVASRAHHADIGGLTAGEFFFHPVLIFYSITIDIIANLHFAFFFFQVRCHRSRKRLVPKKCMGLFFFVFFTIY